MAIYLNNAATSWPKPETVAWAMADFISYGGGNHGRGVASARDMETMKLLLQCRERVAELFGGYIGANPQYVSFTSNVTESLNIVLRGYLRPGMRVLTSSMEHNAVIRPLRDLEQQGVTVSILQCDNRGKLDPRLLEAALVEKADLLVLSHASNVCGTVQDVAALSQIAKRHDLPVVLDAAQTGGLLDINVSELGLAALCFTGHKGLYGPQGIGGILWHPEFAHRCKPLITGGTGSFSHEEFQPETLPDKFEAGTPNLPGLAGFLAALEWIQTHGVEKLFNRKDRMTQFLLNEFSQIDEIQLYGPMPGELQMPVIALNISGMDNATAAEQLAQRWGIESRPGLHCAPVAHKTLGTFPQGTLRLSPGFFNTEDEIAQVASSVRTLARTAMGLHV